MPTGGFLLIDKPEGPTTFQLLNPLKRRWKGEKVGHAGTLDSGASGLVIAAVGPSSRLLSLIEAQEKEYSFRLHLGFSTTTGDLTGDLLEQSAPSSVEIEKVKAALPQFTGDIQQVPPLYSALKIDGKRASDRVRAGESVVLKPRQVTVSEFEILSFQRGERGMEIDFSCVVSKGTYVRSLGADLAAALGCLGTVSRIRRHRIGRATLRTAWGWERNGEPPLPEPPDRWIALPSWIAPAEELRLLKQGVRIDLSRLLPFDGTLSSFKMMGEKSQLFLYNTEKELQLYAELTTGHDPYASADRAVGLLVAPRVQLWRESSK